MHIAVAIVGYNNPNDIAECLDALARSSYADFEVVICENGGAAAYKALAPVIPPQLTGGQKVRAILAPKNLGYAGGVNVCLKATPFAGAWWMLNPDTKPNPNAMAALVKRLAAGDCDAVGGTLHFPDGRVQTYGGCWQPWLARAVSIGYGRALTIRVNPSEIERRQNYLSGASMMLGRRFLENVGLMREDYFLYCEEVEWCLRGLARGMRLGFAPEAMVLHIQGTTTGSVGDLTMRSRMPIYLDHRNRILVTYDTFPMRLPVVAVVSFALLFLRYGRRRAWRQLGYAISGWFAGILNRRGAPHWLAE